MDLMSILRLAMRALARNKMRSILTMLGVIIGVGAVIASVAVGEGASEQIQEQISNLGDNMIWVEAGGRAVNGVRTGSRGTKTLVMGDVKAIQQQVPLVYNCSGHVDRPVQIVYGNQNWFSQARGVAPEFLLVRRLGIARGGIFSQDDVDHSANVCLLGQTIVDNLFGSADPVGQTIRIQNLPIRVIGVLSPKGQSPTGQDQDDTLIVPLTTMQKKIKGIDWLDDIMCSAVSPAAIRPAEQQITSLLRERHHLRADEEEDFNLRHPAEIASARAESQRIMTILLASIASVSLLVGGIGIMNIMLVSVTERTREIGLRLAIGANEGDVRMQFLGEATLLSLLGGAIGVIIGVVGSLAISRTLRWPTRIPIQALVVAVLFSAAVGVFFGFYPAYKASHLDPIEALRYE
ncbi:MAG: multidrug ABC transporter substrate-binding protein [Acidobacteria bacterium]|nr:MAG: multidrug ABC transporter substrate-binding protein [Acidobacteriota bacterium]